MNFKSQLGACEKPVQGYIMVVGRKGGIAGVCSWLLVQVFTVWRRAGERDAEVAGYIGRSGTRLLVEVCVVLRKDSEAVSRLWQWQVKDTGKECRGPTQPWFRLPPVIRHTLPGR